ALGTVAERSIPSTTTASAALPLFVERWFATATFGRRAVAVRKHVFTSPESTRTMVIEGWGTSRTTRAAGSATAAKIVAQSSDAVREFFIELIEIAEAVKMVNGETKSGE